jgi:hypothetical protein
VVRVLGEANFPIGSLSRPLFTTAEVHAGRSTRGKRAAVVGGMHRPPVATARTVVDVVGLGHGGSGRR